MRYTILLILALLPGAAFTQSSSAIHPKVTLESPGEDVIVGQPAILRIKVLVPTFMPSPPVFPSLEQENLLVRLPERASGPISESVDGETWSGVQRSYRLYPLVSGPIDLGTQSMTVTFADPETSEPIQVSVPLPPSQINAVIPDGARGLDPLIIATEFELSQEIEGSTDLQAGDAVTRRLTGRISGTSSIMIPPLIQENQDPLLRSYPKEPRFTESEDRGVLSGQRIDEVVYLAQDGGQTQLPPVSLQWFNLTTNTVETADVEAVDLQLAKPKSEPLSADAFIKYVTWTIIAALCFWALWRWLKPRVQTWMEERQTRYRASAEFALADLKRALHDHDLSAAYSALETWKQRCSAPQGYSNLETQLAQIGSARYASDSKGKAPDWSGAISALDSLSKSAQTQANPLPKLNP